MDHTATTRGHRWVPGRGERSDGARHATGIPQLSAEVTDEEIVAAFVAGDEAAFDALVQRYRQRVYGICLHYFGNPSDAEDAAQDAFVAVYRRASTFTGAAAFSTWLYRVTTNACNDVARKRARRPQASVGGMERLENTPAVDDVLGNRELGVELESALATLDAEAREAVVLHDVAGLPYTDIAARLGVAVGTVKSRIHRAHGRLAVALAHLREPDGPAQPPTEQT